MSIKLIILDLIHWFKILVRLFFESNPKSGDVYISNSFPSLKEVFSATKLVVNNCEDNMVYYTYIDNEYKGSHHLNVEDFKICYKRVKQ